MKLVAQTTANKIPIARAGLVQGLGNPDFKNKMGQAKFPGQFAYRSAQATWATRIKANNTMQITVSMKKNS